MPRVYIMAIEVKDRLELEEVVARGRDWRCRERAQTLLLLDSGLSAEAVAAELKLNVRTVLTTRRNWFRDGLESLPDLARTGAPKKITDDDLTRIAAAAAAQPLSGRQLLAVHVAGGGVPVVQSTLIAALKSAGMVWKRTRHSLKKSAMKPPSESPRPRSNTFGPKLRRVTLCWRMSMKQGFPKFTRTEAPGR